MISKIKEIFKWRELIFGLVLKDLKIKYRRATGGFGWMLVMPLVQTAIFAFIFGFLFKIRIENYPLFLLSGLFAWSFLRSSLDSAANCILLNASLIKKAYFPREVLPVSNVITNLVSFFFSIVILFAFSLFSKVSISFAILWLPLIITIQVILVGGISLFISGLNAIYRETQFMMDVILLIWFYATPVVYSFGMARDALPQKVFFLYKLNPMTGIICAYQNIFLYGVAPDLALLFPSILAALLFFIFGFISFNRYGELFIDMV